MTIKKLLLQSIFPLKTKHCCIITTGQNSSVLQAQQGSLQQPCLLYFSTIYNQRCAVKQLHSHAHRQASVNFCTMNTFLLWQCLETLLGTGAWHCNSEVTVSKTAGVFLSMYVISFQQHTSSRSICRLGAQTH